MNNFTHELDFLSSKRCFRPIPYAESIPVYTCTAKSDQRKTWSVEEATITDAASVSSLAGTLSKPDEAYACRLMSETSGLSQQNSFSRLNATSPTLQEIMTQHSVGPGFFNIVSSFYHRTLSVEEGLCLPFEKYDSQDYLEYMYVFKYAEETGRGGDDAWSIRQTALYHQFRRTDKRSTFILITPYPASMAMERILSWLRTLPTSEALHQQRLHIHRLLVDSYLDGPRFYMQHFERRGEELALRLLNVGLKDPDGAVATDLAELNYIERNLFPLQAMFASWLGILKGLEKTGDLHMPPAEKPAWEEWINNRLERTKAYQENLNVLLRKMESSAQLLSGFLDFKNAAVAQKQSNMVLQLTYSTVDDSATVRVITTITLIFLSFTTVAAIFAMPIFYLHDKTRALSVSPSIWIYLVITVPLTMMTLAYWRFSLEKKRRKNKAINAEAERSM